MAAADRPAVPDVNELEQGLRLLGLIGITDPPRRTAAATIASCRAAGITPVLITGDHPATADAIAAELGILHPGNDVIDCTDPTADLADPRARVFARATPEQKLAIITTRQAAGDVVAMTGDGVNDGPALRRADIGVARVGAAPKSPARPPTWSWPMTTCQTVVTAAGEGRRVYGTSAGSCSTGCPAAAPRSRSCSPGPPSVWRCPCCPPRSCGSTCSPTACPASPWAASPPSPAS